MTGSCARDADCSSAERCVPDPTKPPADRVSPALTCSAPIGMAKERDRCTQASDCESGLCALADVCLSPCASDDDCSAGQRCQALEARVASEALAPVMACARSSAFSADVQLSPAGEQSLSATALNEVMSVGSDGTSLVYIKAACDRRMEVQTLRALSENRDLFDLSALLNGEERSQNPVSNSGALVPVLVPNNPAVSPSPDGYELGVAIDADGQADVVTASRTGEHHIIDINLFYVGGGEDVQPGGLHPGSAEMALVMQKLDERYQKIGLRIGSVREHDVLGSLREELGVLETEIVRDSRGQVTDLKITGIEQLFALSAGVDDGGINLFVVREMGDVLGISGGIPGALGVHGTEASGVAIALDVVGAFHADQVLMHEMSHQMGLFHTSELDGFVIEPLSDTPECASERDTNRDGVLSSSECARFGADNLMFWAGTGTEVSEQQAHVLRRSLVLR